MPIKYTNQFQEPFTYAGRLVKMLFTMCVLASIAAVVLHVQIQDFVLHAMGYSSAIGQLSRPEYVPVQIQQVLGSNIAAGLSFIDMRAYVLDSYFAGSPLEGTGHIFVSACDRYGAPADCTTLPAIAKAETDLCRYYNSAEYHNCWGFGGGGTDRIKFNSWDESIDLITDRLVNKYGIKYIIDPSLMEKTFCGSDPGCTNWGNRIKYYMNEISEYAKELGFSQNLFDLRK